MYWEDPYVITGLLVCVDVTSEKTTFCASFELATVFNNDSVWTRFWNTSQLVAPGDF